MKNTALVLALAIGGASGFAAFEQGRFEEAWAVWRDAEARAGDDAPATLIYDRALAGLRAGVLADAAAAAARAEAVAGDDVEMASACSFLAGNVAFAACLRAESEAGTLASPVVALDRAIAEAEAARDAWRRAALARDDWPAARRNVERALVKLDALRARRADEQPEESDPSPPDEVQPAEPDPGAPGRPPEPTPTPAPPGADDAVREDRTLETSREDLSPAQIAGLLERLARAEREKVAQRRAERAAGADGGRW